MGTVHSMTQVRTAAAIVAGIAFHPVISGAERAQMSPHELVYFFGDTEAAQEAARLDFERARMIEARNQQAFRAHAGAR